MTTADQRKRQDDERQRGAWRPSRLQAMLAIVVAAVAIIAVLAAVRYALNEWACKMSWSAPCANGAPLDLSPPKPGAKRRYMAEQKSAPTPSPNRAQEALNEALFVGAMADPVRRRIAFNVVERNCRERFTDGDNGIRLYVQLLNRVRSSKVDEAAMEFETRFRPMLDQQRLKDARSLVSVLVPE